MESASKRNQFRISALDAHHVSRLDSALTMKKLFQNTFVYSLGGIAAKGGGLILLPLLTRYLSPYELGQASILQWVIFFSFSILSLGLSSAIGPIYFLTTVPLERISVIWTTFFVLLGSFILLSIAAIFVPSIYLKITLIHSGLMILILPF